MQSTSISSGFSSAVRALRAQAREIMKDYVFGDLTEWEVEVFIPNILSYDDKVALAYHLLLQQYQLLLSIRERQHRRKATEKKLIGIEDVRWGVRIVNSPEYPAEEYFDVRIVEENTCQKDVT